MSRVQLAKPMNKVTPLNSTLRIISNSADTEARAEEMPGGEVEPAIERDSAATGTQTVARALNLLRIIGRCNPIGISLTNLAVAAGLTRPTAHRLVACLVTEGFAQKDPFTRKYDLGVRAFQLGLTTSAFSEVQRVCSASINRIAAMTNDMVCVAIRTGVDSVPISEAPASVPVRQLNLRRYGEPAPIGATPSGVALLAGFTHGQVRTVLKRNLADPMRRHRSDIKTITADVEACRRLGYAIRVNYHFAGVAGIAVAIPSKDCPPFLALSNISSVDRIDGPRKQFIVDTLTREANDLAFQLTEHRLIGG